MMSSDKIGVLKLLFDLLLIGLSTKVGKILPGSRPTYVGGAPRSRENGEVILFQDLSRWVDSGDLKA